MFQIKAIKYLSHAEGKEVNLLGVFRRKVIFQRMGNSHTNFQCEPSDQEVTSPPGRYFNNRISCLLHIQK